jgi:hypothetical protein
MPGAGAPPGAAGGTAGPTMGDAQAAKLVAPLPAGGQPAARPESGAEVPVAPQAVRERTARAAVKQPPTRRLQPGDLVCGECGEGNPPNRKFCSRCGSSLESAVAVKTPWWRKLLPKRKAKVLEAGARPGRGGVRAKSRRAAALAKVLPTVRKVVAMVVLVTGLVYGAFTPFRSTVNDRIAEVKHRIDRKINPHYEPVNSNHSSATALIRGHDSGKAVDGFSNTYWAAPTGGREVVLILTFDHKVDVDKAIVHSGISANFQSTNRPQNLHIVYSTNQTFDVELKDSPDKQEVSIGNGHGITSMEIHITQMYKAVKSSDVAITEIELFRKE